MIHVCSIITYFSLNISSKKKRFLAKNGSEKLKSDAIKF